MVKLKYICRVIFFAGVSVWLLWGNQSFILAGTLQGPGREKIDKPKNSLEKLNRRLQQMQKRQSETAREERSILKQLELSDRLLQVKRRELSAIEAKIRQRDNEIKALHLQLDPLQQVLAAQRTLVGDRLETIYKEGKAPYLRVLMASQDYHDFLKSYVYLQRVTQKDSDMLAGFEQAVLALEQKSVMLQQMKTVLMDDRTELKAKLSEIAEEKRNKDVLLARIRGEKATSEQAIQELKEASQRLQGLIKGLERKRGQSPQPNRQVSEKLGRGGITQTRGSLNWPADGVLVSRFGLQKHPKFDTYVYRKGIEIGSFQGEHIRSVYEGQVAYADWFPGYGMVIILDHGENYFSLYAHLSKLLVSVGDYVKKDQVIGEIGDTGVSEGDRLYFELRRGDKPVNPLNWLKAKP